MGLPEQIAPFHAVIRQPAAAGAQITHLPVKNGQRHRGMLDEQLIACRVHAQLFHQCAHRPCQRAHFILARLGRSPERLDTVRLEIAHIARKSGDRAHHPLGNHPGKQHERTAQSQREP